MSSPRSSSWSTASIRLQRGGLERAAGQAEFEIDALAHMIWLGAVHLVDLVADRQVEVAAVEVSVASEELALLRAQIERRVHDKAMVGDVRPLAIGDDVEQVDVEVHDLARLQKRDRLLDVVDDPADVRRTRDDPIGCALGKILVHQDERRCRGGAIVEVLGYGLDIAAVRVVVARDRSCGLRAMNDVVADENRERTKTRPCPPTRCSVGRTPAHVRRSARATRMDS